jgi:hypothetical protein
VAVERWTGTKPTRRTLLCDRTHASAQLVDADGETVRIPTGLNPSESILDAARRNSAGLLVEIPHLGGRVKVSGHLLV